MGEASITWIIIILIAVGLKYFFKKKNGHRREYSLGLKSANDIQVLIKNKEYATAEEKAKNQNLNDITQIIDHLSLSLKEDEILKWNESTESDFSKLTLGVYYLHIAWIFRSHKFAKNVSNKQAENFFDYLQKCEETFETITTESFYNPEVASRKIRLYMSLGNYTLATTYYNNLYLNHPDFIWPHIHYSELIQPKWGGKIKDLERFYENLPNNFLIHSIVELKLIHDSTVMNDNYFKKHNTDLTEFAREKIIQIDTEFNQIEINSVHQYILYNYMEITSDKLKLKGLKKKYEKLADGNYTIYPYGLIN